MNQEDALDHPQSAQANHGTATQPTHCKAPAHVETRGTKSEKHHRGLRTKTLMRGLGTGLECGHKNIVEVYFGEKFDSYPAGLESAAVGSIAQDHPSAPSPQVIYYS